MKSFKKSNTSGKLKSMWLNWIELIASMTDCSALLVSGVHTCSAVAVGQYLSATRTILYLCGGKQGVMVVWSFRERLPQGWPSEDLS